MFSLINRGQLPQAVEDELEQLVTRLRALWLTEHKEDGTHQPTSFEEFLIEGIAPAVKLQNNTSSVAGRVTQIHNSGVIMSNNLYSDGINWHRDDVTKPGMLIQLHPTTVFTVWYVGPGPNPASTLTEVAIINSDGDLILDGDVDAVNIDASGDIIADGDIDGDNINADADITAGGNISAVDVDASGDITGVDIEATGDLTAAGSVFEAGRAVAMGDWADYTPVWSSTGTQPSLGDGQLLGQWTRIGETVFFDIRLTMGASTTYGTGTWLLSFPVASTVGSLGAFNAQYREAGIQNVVGGARLNSSTTLFMIVHGGVNVSPTAPFTWGAGDQIFVSGCYKA